MTNPSIQSSNGDLTNDSLYLECLEKAEGDKIRALAIYNHLKVNNQQHIQEDLDQREKWPMLVPLLILYTLGTLGVLGLVFGFLASELDW